jgi:uncharacterized phiE125 gp8 family phage protein
MALKLKTPSTVDIVSLDDAKKHCRVDHADDDDYISLLIKAAVSHLDGYRGILGRCIGEQTWELVYDEFPCGPLRIDLPDLMSVVAVKYINENGLEVTMPDTDYMVDNKSSDGWVIPYSEWPIAMETANAISVEFKAGFGSTTASIPESVRFAVLLLVGNWYMNREPVLAGETPSEIPFTVACLINQWRILKVY